MANGVSVSATIQHIEATINKKIAFLIAETGFVVKIKIF